MILDEMNIYTAINKNRDLYDRICDEAACAVRLFGRDDAPYECQLFFNPTNLALQRVFPGDVEFHHTCAFSVGPRPYIFHCESFLPVFFPILKQGEGIKAFEQKEIDKIRIHYRNIFESRKCLTIVSHLRETLDQFSSFFGSKTIDSKLHHIPIGLDRQTSNRLRNQRNLDNFKSPTFLFTGSAHQNPAAFKMRGGVLSIRLLQWFRENKRSATFIFRCAKPSDRDLISFNISHISLESCSTVKIIWLTDYLSDDDILNLYRMSDFLLLPSANLHSISVMQAMTAGCIPIVTDTQGIYEFVIDGVDGFVVDKVKNKCWVSIDNHRLWVDDHELFYTLEDEILTKLIDILSTKLDDHSSLAKTSKNALSKARNEFRAERHMKAFWNVVRAATKDVDTSRKYSQLDLSPYARNIDVKRDFGGPIIPILVGKSQNTSIYKLRNLYWAFRGDRPDIFHNFVRLSVFDPKTIEYTKNNELTLANVERLRGSAILDHVYGFIARGKQLLESRKYSSYFPGPRGKKSE